MKKTVSVDFKSYKESIKEALDLAGAAKELSVQTRILLKPNLVNGSPFPVTTTAECCACVIEYIRQHSSAEIVIAEGCGDKDLETSDIFRILGYEKLSQDYDVRLLDLNYAPLRKLENKECTVFPEMYLPEIAFTHFVFSLPVLKAHSLSVITGTLKNMVGFAPPEYYSGTFGIWKKAVFHENTQQAIIDLNSYRTPDLTLIDGRLGLSEYHLGGAVCDPPVNKIIAGFDPVETDRVAAKSLGIDWRTVPHLNA